MLVIVGTSPAIVLCASVILDSILLPFLNRIWLFPMYFLELCECGRSFYTKTFYLYCDLNLKCLMWAVCLFGHYCSWVVRKKTLRWFCINFFTIFFYFILIYVTFLVSVDNNLVIYFFLFVFIICCWNFFVCRNKIYFFLSFIYVSQQICGSPVIKKQTAM